MGRAGGLGVVAASAVVAIEGRRKGGTRTAPTGMTGGSATLCWEWYVESGGNDATGGLIYLSYSFPGVRAWS